jgi:quercetin dioxygenase-like cupin family protein
MTALHKDFATFRQNALDRGYTEVLERRWAAGQVVGEHTHPFAASALVVEGEMWLTVGRETRHLRPGDRFELDAEVPHDERYGADGALYWVARR